MRATVQFYNPRVCPGCGRAQDQYGTIRLHEADDAVLPAPYFWSCGVVVYVDDRTELVGLDSLPTFSMVREIIRTLRKKGLSKFRMMRFKDGKFRREGFIGPAKD